MFFLEMLLLVLGAYVAIAVVSFLYLMVRAVTWNGTHENFHSYYFGVMLDVDGFMLGGFRVAKYSFAWPLLCYDAFAHWRSRARGAIVKRPSSDEDIGML